MKWLLFAIPLVLLASGTRGQDWTKLPSPPSDGNYTTPYFLNANIGFKFNAGFVFEGDAFNWQPTPPGLARTTDGGFTWSSLHFFDSSGYSITQLSFVSLTHGYASTIPNYTASVSLSGGIFETLDQGNHWKKITPDGLSFSGVYASNHTIFASEINNLGTQSWLYGAILYSRDDGTTWDSITSVKGLTLGAQPLFQFIYGNRDSLVATVYFTNNVHVNGDTYLVFSTDLGKTWNSSLLDRSYWYPMVSLHISPHSCNILRQFLSRQDYAYDDTYSFLESSPPYSSWDSALMHRETGAWVDGSSCASYLSDAASATGPGDRNGSVLLFRSTDEGVSWQPIYKEGGNNPDFTEIDDWDWQNLSVVGYGAVIYASDNFAGSLWKSTDGGDSALSEASLPPQIKFGRQVFPSLNDTLIVPQCSSATAVVYYQNLGCAITRMDSISVAGLPSNQYSLKSTHDNDCFSSFTDGTYIRFAPISVGTYPITVNVHFTDDEYNTIDTSLSFILDVQPGSAPVSVSLSFLSSSMNASPGDTIQVPVYLNGTASLGATSITLPFGVDTNILWPVGFQPALAGLTAGSSYYSAGTENVLLQTDSNFSLNGQTLIGYLRCIVYLTDTLSTTITLPTPSLTASMVPCTALSVTTDSIAVNVGGCGTKTLQQFMLTGRPPIFGIRSIIPNPATSEITVFGGSEPFTISDPLGRSYIIPQNGNVLDISALPSGVYFVSDGISGAKFVKE